MLVIGYGILDRQFSLQFLGIGRRSRKKLVLVQYTMEITFRGSQTEMETSIKLFFPLTWALGFGESNKRPSKSKLVLAGFNKCSHIAISLISLRSRFHFTAHVSPSSFLKAHLYNLSSVFISVCGRRVL